MGRAWLMAAYSLVRQPHGWVSWLFCYPHLPGEGYSRAWSALPSSVNCLWLRKYPSQALLGRCNWSHLSLSFWSQHVLVPQDFLIFSQSLLWLRLLSKMHVPTEVGHDATWDRRLSRKCWVGSLRSFVPAHLQPSPMKSSKEQIYVPLRIYPPPNWSCPYCFCMQGQVLFLFCVVLF